MDDSVKNDENLEQGIVKSMPEAQQEPVATTSDDPDSQALNASEELAPVEAAPQIVNAPEQPITLETVASETPKPGHKKWLLITAIVGGVLLIGGLVAWLVLRGADKTVNTNTSTKSSIRLLGVAPLLVEGASEYSTNGKTWQTLTTTVSLKQGDSVKTGTDGRVVLAIDDGSAVRLNHNSQVRLTNLAPASIQVENISGQLYSRVVPSTTRTFSVLAEDQSYVAQGTAYCVTNSVESQGVEVFHSSVKVAKQVVPEGNSYYIKSTQKDKENKVVAIDVSVMKQDDFLKWNAEQDKKVAEYANKLGVLGEFDKPSTTTTQTQTTTTANNTGITLSGSVSEYTANMKWSVTNVDTSKGFKVVYSTKTTTPVYPGNDYQYIEDSTARSTAVKPNTGGTYYFRVCAYRGGSCDSYSNAVKIVIPTKPAEPEEQIVPGALVLSVSGSTASWTVGGTAPKGFKVVASTTKTAPEYPTDGYKAYTQATSVDLSTILTAGTWNVRVCKYTGSGCTDYSNTIVYVKS